ncbi:MAG: biotin--[acetyl-CoA-carboxylase] ligase [Lysinibacillus sp.]
MTTMKEKILQRLLEAKGNAISGQTLADEFEISRTAVWKHMQALEQQGYTIETVKKKGYVLTNTVDRLSAASVAMHLETARYGQSYYHFEELTTTQAIAHEQVRAGAPDGTVIVAEHQTAGKGRMLREWSSSNGKGIWMTLLIRPEIPPHQAPQFTLVAAVAVVNAIKALYPSVDARIKWPNDILINGKKCTGILTEMVAEADRVEAILIGIGINVNQRMEDFPNDLQTIATSLSIVIGEHIDRAVLLAKVLFYMEHYCDIYVKYGFARLKELWEEASITIGHRVRATTLREVIEGTAIGITEFGVLQIKSDKGEIVDVYSADIELLNNHL